jgi:hypothetical protein
MPLAMGRADMHPRTMPDKRPKRPRDLNQRAKRMVDIVTGEVEDREPPPEKTGEGPSATGMRKGLAQPAPKTFRVGHG